MPFAWPESDLTSALKEDGWEEISAVAYPTRKIRPWLLRCKAPDSLDRVAGISSGNVMTVLERAGPMGPTAQNFKKLRVQPRVAKRAGPIIPQPIDLEQDEEHEPDATLMDTQVSEDADQGMELRFRKEVSNVLEQLPRPNLRARKKSLDPAQRNCFFLVSLIDLDCGADGSRGLNCIAVGTAIMRGGKFKDLEPKKATMGATLRVQVATHIAKSEKDYKPLLSADVSNASVAREDGDIPTTWESWLHAILRHRHWIGLSYSVWHLSKEREALCSTRQLAIIFCWWLTLLKMSRFHGYLLDRLTCLIECFAECWW